MNHGHRALQKRISKEFFKTKKVPEKTDVYCYTNTLRFLFVCFMTQLRKTRSYSSLIDGSLGCTSIS